MSFKKTMERGDMIIICEITSYDSFLKLINILIDKDIKLLDTMDPITVTWMDSIYKCYSDKYFNNENGFGLAIKDNALVGFASTNYFKIRQAFCDDIPYPEAKRISVSEFLEQEQVQFSYKGYKGSYEKSVEDNCWFGKIEDLETDLIMYESKTLVRLEQEFIQAVEEYIETLKQIEQQKDNTMKNLSVLRDGWIDPTTHEDRGWFVYNNASKLYVYKDGSEFATVVEAPENEVFFSTEQEALSTMNEMLAPEKTSIYTDSQIEEVRKLACLLIIELIVEAKFIGKETFSYHDVMKGLREIYGPGVELKYDDFKDRIINIVEDNAEEFNYNKYFNGEYDEWSLIKEDDHEDLDAILDSIDDDDDEVDTSIITIVSTKKCYIVPVDQVRSSGMGPGDKAYVVAVDKMIGYNKSYEDLMFQVNKNDVEILLEGIYTVDKYGNLHIGRKFFEAADLMDSFNKAMGISFSTI